ncbi:MAG: bifunctional glutamate N-acetyltransferase/amino-acid acetyltransferase ArgJ [Oscillospiraceae bacterium]
MSVTFEGFEFIDGGVCAPKGFTAAGVHCGIRKNKEKLDLALVYCDTCGEATAVYTTNKVKGAPIAVTKAHLRDNTAQAIICNSGNANTCNADGEIKAELMCELCAAQLKIRPEDVIVASTGVIGQVLPIEPIETALPDLANSLSKNGNENACQAILTTDTRKKEFAVKFKIGETECTIGGMAKGSGMIHPNMATLLCFITTDIVMKRDLFKRAFKQVCEDTFNMVSIDGDTSTNDMATIITSKQAKNAYIYDSQSLEYETFVNALYVVMMNLAREIARDGEGATKLLECAVGSARDTKIAKAVAKSVITSNLFKCAMFGEDANWGRILCAIGYTKGIHDVSGISVRLSSSNGTIEVCKNGAGVEFSEERAAKILSADTIKILIELNEGTASALAWGCDLTYDYIKINGDYRT